MAMTPEELKVWRAHLACEFPSVQAVFANCMEDAMLVLTPPGMTAYLDCARMLGKMGRGPEPVLALLQEWPQIAQVVGEGALSDVTAILHSMQKSPNSAAMAPLLQTLAAVARCLQGPSPFRQYLQIVLDVMARTSVSIHGHHTTFASPGLPVLLEHAPRLLGALTVAGLARWADYGMRHYQHHPQRQREYFALQLADSRAVYQRERHGTLFANVENQLSLTLRALWQTTAPLCAYVTGLSNAPTTAPWSTHHTTIDSICLPDVYDALPGQYPVSGIDRYHAALAHIAAHRRWSQALVADNLSPLQRLTTECLEDARVDHLLLLEYPGLRPLLLALHPRPAEEACNPAVVSCVRHRLAMLSHALLNPLHGYSDVATIDCAATFHTLLKAGESSTHAMKTLALQHAARTRCHSDQLAQVFFENTIVSYRDDNRHLWIFIEEGDEEDTFAKARPSTDSHETSLPPRHYPEWDAFSQSYRPDWVSVYEALHPSGDARHIDALLDRHAGLARQLKQLLDLLKPQERVRIRYQEEGSELDMDVALQSFIDWRAGAEPETRVLMSHRTNGRSIAVMVLLDLSQSLNDTVPGNGQTRLTLSQEAVALLAWAIDQVGDPFALAGFHSNTRHEVRYHHIKGFGEDWSDAPKARLAALRGQYSTRMGAAIRHAAHYLGTQTTEKKLLLVLTDGRPSDVDTPDENALVADARQAVCELAQEKIHAHCISLDQQADTYVRDIFGQHATVVDRIEQLPERLTRLFVNLTK